MDLLDKQRDAARRMVFLPWLGAVDMKAPDKAPARALPRLLHRARDWRGRAALFLETWRGAARRRQAVLRDRWRSPRLDTRALARSPAQGQAAVRRSLSHRRRATPINLALQGGGGHGAFTWGVLDWLLTEDALRIDAVSGASAGAMNAVVLASGLLEGGIDRARAQLEAFWRDIARLGSGLGVDAGGDALRRSLESMTRLVSPYHANPFNVNPLRTVLERHVDFARLRDGAPVRLFIAATDIATAETRIFTGGEITPDAILASACLPQIHQAVTIDGRAYWDGGFSANPPILPLIDQADARDTVLVRLLPAVLPGVPTDPTAILDRQAHLIFAAPLNQELTQIANRRVAARRGLARFGGTARRALRHRFHLIEAPDLAASFGRSSASDPDWARLEAMRDLGRRHADRWMRETRANLGRRPSFAIDAHASL